MFSSPAKPALNYGRSWDFNVANLNDEEIWSIRTPSQLDAKLWPFVLLTILGRLWDARNGEIFRLEPSSSRSIISKICDDLVVWRKRLKRHHDVNSLNSWRHYLLSCNSPVRFS